MAESIDIQGGGLFQIAEPEAPKQRRRKLGKAVGIDLGTTHSLVAIAPEGADPKVLADARGESLLPSVVSYVGEQTLVGRGAQAQAIAHPQQVLSSVKRFMGRGPKDIDFRHPYKLAADDQVVRLDVSEAGRAPRHVSPVEVSARILEVLRERAAEVLDEVTGAVITVPAYFDDAQRQATKDAGRIAGLEVFRLLAEPTAAALAYGLDRQGDNEGSREGLYAVYDLGGGTFDISILRLRRGVFQVLATGGDSALGGDDFDRALALWLLEQAGVSEPSPAQQQELMQVARAAKEALSDAEQTEVTLELCKLAPTALTRAKLEELIAPLVKQTIRASKATLKDAGLAKAELDGVVLVGGSTRVPLVRAQVEKAFGKAPLGDIDPDKVVAYGAAIQADILSGSEREGVTLLDVVPLSLGLETMGGIVEKIIPRNATIPISARQVFTNYSEKQTGMSMHVVQGERELADDCRSLARFDLAGIPRLPPSMARVEVSFELDADALLTVTARELMTGVKQSIEVKPTYGLSGEEVDELIMDSLDHAREDFEARNLAEARVELGRSVLAVTAALEEVGEVEGLLSREEREAIVLALEVCEAARSKTHADEVNAALEQLEKLSEPFARRRMERALRSGMSGKSLAEIESALAEEEQLAARRGGHEAELIEAE